MTGQQEAVLLAWARDAGGDSQRFTGADIYTRVGVWCMQRLQRDIPTISTFHCQAGDHHFTISVAMVPERAIPLGVRLRHPDEVDTLGGAGVTPWVLLAYKTAEDD